MSYSMSPDIVIVIIIILLLLLAVAAGENISRKPPITHPKIPLPSTPSSFLHLFSRSE
jgi:hypothetical protein